MQEFWLKCICGEVKGLVFIFLEFFMIFQVWMSILEKLNVVAKELGMVSQVLVLDGHGVHAIDNNCGKLFVELVVEQPLFLHDWVIFIFLILVLHFVGNQILILIFWQLFCHDIIVITFIGNLALNLFWLVVFHVKRFHINSFFFHFWCGLFTCLGDVHRSDFLQEVLLHLVELLNSWLRQRIVSRERHVKDWSVIGEIRLRFCL